MLSMMIIIIQTVFIFFLTLCCDVLRRPVLITTDFHRVSHTWRKTKNKNVPLLLFYWNLPNLIRSYWLNCWFYDFSVPLYVSWNPYLSQCIGWCVLYIAVIPHALTTMKVDINPESWESARRLRHQSNEKKIIKLDIALRILSFIVTDTAVHVYEDE